MRPENHVIGRSQGILSILLWISSFKGLWYGIKIKGVQLKIIVNIKKQCPNLMNLSHVSNPPKTGFNWSPAQMLKNLIQFQVEPTIFEQRVKFKPRLKFFKSGLWQHKFQTIVIHINTNYNYFFIFRIVKKYFYYQKYNACFFSITLLIILLADCGEL